MANTYCTNLIITTVTVISIYSQSCISMHAVDDIVTYGDFTGNIVEALWPVHLW